MSELKNVLEETYDAQVLVDDGEHKLTLYKKKPFDQVDFCMRFESGEMDSHPDELIAGFQEMINSGIVWKLQGVYGRSAKALIDLGHCKAKEGDVC